MSNLHNLLKFANERSEIIMDDSIKRTLGIDNAFNTLLDSVSDVIFLKDLNGNYIECNKKFAELNCLSKEEIIGKNDYQLYDEETANNYIMDDKHIIENCKPKYYEAWTSFPDGRPVFYNTLKSPFRDKDDEIVGILSISRDYTESKLLELKLLEREEYLESVLNTTHDGFFLVDLEGFIVDVNRASCNILGYTKEELIGSHISKIDENLLDADFSRILLQEIRKNSKIFETTHRKKNGTLLDIEISASILDGNNAYVVCFARDVTEKKNKMKYIQRLSYHDFLTGLYNKRFMDIHMKKIDQESNLPITVMVLDMDNLKVTNDSFGHATGDRLIREVARTIKACFRQDELIGRVGGDEFLIVLPKVGESEAEKIIQRIKDSIENIDLGSVVISLSAGYAVKNEPTEDITEIQSKADNMMYIDKIANLNDKNREIVNSFMERIFSKSPLEREHSTNVMNLSINLGKSVGLSKEQLHDLSMAARYHDIGKISIPGKIMNKNSSLDLEEYDEMRKHSETGYRILKSMEEFYGISKVVLHHHARWDGSGYPLGISGEEIPLLSRILAIAEAYDDMINPRGYKKAKSIEEAKDELIKSAGSQFDPSLVSVFLENVLK